MNRKLLYKIVAIVGMSILLLVPLAMIEGQIRERSQRQYAVQQNIAESSASAQTLVGPLIVLRYRERLRETHVAPETGKVTKNVRVIEYQRLIAPETLTIDGEVKVETRQRGIYQARLFHLDSQTASRFRFSAPPPNSDAELLDLQATLVVGLSDPRGIASDPEVTVNGQHHRFTSGKVDPEIMPVQPLTVALGPIEAGKAHDFSVAFPLRLTGTTRLSVAPVGESNRIALQSAWPHPNFGGRFLPRERSVGADGFKARWEVSHLARNFTNALNPGSGEALSIDFIDPVNVYLQAERAVKYGVLFIVLTFAGFFLIETLSRAPIHPLQYLLVGLALAIFFLLLIALSEHMPFAAAYGASAAACIGLISAYLSGVFGGWRRGAAFGSGLTGLYGVLFGVLRSEDNALLMGSLLLFTALGAVMLATRRLDWYKLDGKAESV